MGTFKKLMADPNLPSWDDDYILGDEEGDFPVVHPLYTKGTKINKVGLIDCNIHLCIAEYIYCT
jgi:hypothetical protein